MTSIFRSREDLILENLALRQQLLALHAVVAWRAELTEAFIHFGHGVLVKYVTLHDTVTARPFDVGARMIVQSSVEVGTDAHRRK